MSELPPGWSEATLASLGGLVGGKTPSKGEAAFWTNGEICWASPKDMKSFLLGKTEDLISRAAVREAGLEILPSGTVLMVTRSGILSHTFPVAVASVPTTINQDIKGLRPSPAALPRYVAYALRAFSNEILKRCAKDGTTVASIATDALQDFPLPFAPIGEQAQIVTKLDTILERFDGCRRRLERVPQLLRRFRGAVLDAAVSGRLTAEWRQRARFQFPSEPDWVQLASLCSTGRVITYGVIKLGDPVHNGVPCLRTSNVRWLHLDADGLKLIDPELSAQYPRTVLKGSEVLVNVRGTLGGVVAVMPNMRGWNVSREVAVVPADDARINPRFLTLWIAARRSQNWLQRVQKGVAYTGINIEDLRTLPVAVPSGEEQAEIVKRVVALFELADRIEQKHQMATRRVERLSPALLGKAFRGELVPQDSGEEAAKEMLEGIRAAQKAAELSDSRTATVVVRGRGARKRGISKERDASRRKRA